MAQLVTPLEELGLMEVYTEHVGQEAYRLTEEGVRVGRGRNYGWSRCEGTLAFKPSRVGPCRVGTLPVHDYAHGDGRCSVTGGYVHRGPTAPEWRGLYVAGDFCGRLFVLARDGSVRLSKDSNRRLSSFGEDLAGGIFATDIEGNILAVGLIGERP